MNKNSNLLKKKLFKRTKKRKNGCIVWIGPKLPPMGYGQTYLGSKHMYTHRLSYLLRYGDIPKNLCVLHKCDNPPCINPKHLFLGTRDENQKDMAKKGRAASGNRNGTKKHPEKMMRGINHVWAKLNPSKVRNIRKLWDSGKYRMKDIGKIYEVNPVTIFHVIHREIWKHVK